MAIQREKEEEELQDHSQIERKTRLKTLFDPTSSPTPIYDPATTTSLKNVVDGQDQSHADGGGSGDELLLLREYTTQSHDETPPPAVAVEVTETPAVALVEAPLVHTGATSPLPPKPTTGQVLPVTGLWHGLIALKDQKYTSLMRVAGFNARLMSSGEKNGYVRRLTAQFNSFSNPFSFYCISKPKSTRTYINRLERKRVTVDKSDREKNFREQYVIVRDELERMEKERSITERIYWAGIEANGADLKALSKSQDGSDPTTAGDDDEDGPGPGNKKKSKPNIFVHAYQQFLIYALGRDPQALAITASISKQSQTGSQGQGHGSRNKGRGRARRVKIAAPVRSTGVPQGLLDTLGFKSQGTADALTLNGLRTRPTTDRENLTMLVEQFDSRLTPEEIAILMGLEQAGPQTPLPEGLDPVSLLGRASFEEYPDCLRVGRDWVASIVVTEYPRNFKFAQLFNLIRFRDVRMSVALHVRPLSVKDAESKLRTKQSILVGTEAENKSQTGNMDRLYKIESIRQLRTVLASGDARIFQVMVVVSVRANRKTTMKENLRRVEQRLSDMNFDTMLPTRNQRRAFLSSIPLGHNFLAGEKLLADRISHPNMTGEGIACLLPTCVADFVQPGGILLGRNKNDGGLIAYNRWLKGSANPHSVLIATTGGGKTVTQMLELLLEYLKYPDMEGYIFDIQNVLGPFARQVNGRVVDLSLAAAECINPMDRFVSMGKPETIGERLSFLYALFALMIKRDLQGPEQNAVGRATKRLYHHFERGESSTGVIYKHFANNPFFAALHPYLLDYQEREDAPLQPGIMTRLRRIWDYLIEKYNVPSSGLVEGHTDLRSGEFVRPICRLYDGKWWYCGEGMTTEPYVEPAEITAIPPGKTRPSGVFYPHPEWWGPLYEEYEEMIAREGLFDMLDDTALQPAIRDAALELKRGQPLMEDLMPFLVAEGALPLADSLESYCDEERFGPIFNHYTTVDLDSRFISWNLKDLDDNLRPVRMFQIVNLVWARVRAYRRRRMLIMDEFQTMVQNFRDVGAFTRDMFQRGRYFRLAMTAIVQNAAALITYPEARLCVQNADRKVFLKQDEAAIGDLLSLYPGLTDGATDILIGASQGEGLIKVGNNNWTHVQYELTPYHLNAWNTNTDQEGEDEFIDESENNDLWKYAFDSVLEADRKTLEAETQARALAGSQRS